MVEAADPICPDDPVISIEPLVMTLRQERYVHISSLHIWDMLLSHENMASLVSNDG